MKYIGQSYTFDASAKTITYDDFSIIERVAIIQNLTTGDTIYDFGDVLRGGTISGTVLTLTYDTTAMSDTDKLQIILHPDVFKNGLEPAQEDSMALVVAPRPAKVDRIGFTKTISAGVDTTWGSIVTGIGTGMGVNQTGGNLVITSGTTARSETIIRSTESFLGGVRLRARSTLSQRIANNNFIVEMVDVIGDSLAYTINSATSITVTLPATFGLSAENVGQSMTIGGFSGTGTFISGRYPIASVSGNDATFTVSGFAVGTGTCSIFGWNFYKLLYDATTATQAKFDTQRNGYASGDTPATISTTASPGHLAVITGNDLVATFADQLVATSATIKQTVRATRDENVPDDVSLKLQIRVLNGTTAPASTTTWTIGLVSVTNFSPMSVSIQDIRPMGTGSALPTETMRSTTNAVTMTSTTLTSVVPGTAATSLGKARDSAIGATDTGVAMLGVRRDAPTAETPVAGDYVVPQVNNFGAQYVSPVAHTAGGATPYKLVSAATTNATSVKASAGQVYMITASNVNAAARYLKLYNKASAPTVGTDVPVLTLVIPGNTAGAGTNIPVPTCGIAFSTGIAFALTTEATDAGTTGVALSEIVVNLGYL